METIKSEIIFVDAKIEKIYDNLQSGTFFEKRLYLELNKAMHVLSQNIFSGIQVKKKLIPKEYIQKYKIDNLWKYNLSGGWRLLYSVTRKEHIQVICLIIEFVDHKNYEKRFKYAV